ncbi:MAG: hypothetical protein ACKVW3_14045 [Phycisphaerales bacterium]
MSGDRLQPQGHPDHLRDFLADSDVPCPDCGYNLRGATTGTCAECGKTITLRPPHWAWQAGRFPQAHRLSRIAMAGWITSAAVAVLFGSAILFGVAAGWGDALLIHALVLPVYSVAPWFTGFTWWYNSRRRPKPIMASLWFCAALNWLLPLSFVGLMVYLLLAWSK